MSLSISWLNAYPRVRSLFEDHISTPRVVGASARVEEDLIAAVEDNYKEHSTFRGIQSLFNSPFEVDDFGGFRGFRSQHLSDNLELNKPPFAAPSEKPVHSGSDSEEEEFDAVARVQAEVDAYLQQNTELLELLKENEALRDAFINGNHQRTDEKLGEATKSELDWSPGLTESYLKEHPDEALIIAADLGDAQELMADPNAVEALTGDLRTRLEDEVFDKLAEKVAGLMKNAALLDKTFFKDHPKAALYLIENPEERRRIEGEKAFEEEFRDHVASYEQMVDPVAKAQDFADGNVALTDEFWRDNEGLALLLWAEKASGQGNRLQLTALQYPPEAYQETTSTEFLWRDQARRAEEILGEEIVLDEDYLSAHPGLSRLIVEQPDFGEKLANDEKTDDFLKSDREALNRVLRAYVSGLPGRDQKSWQWWA
jgi:hypothetical protein